MEDAPEIQKIEAQRTENDKQFRMSGANLVVTDEQIQDARIEMLKDKKVIEFPKDIDRITALQKKLVEYKTRISEDTNLSPEVLTEYQYRIAILTQLLTSGDIHLQKLTDELTKNDHDFNVGLFDDAAGIIFDYVETGGAHVHAGTGLPTK